MYFCNFIKSIISIVQILITIMLMITMLTSCCHHTHEDSSSCHKRTTRNFINTIDDECHYTHHNCPAFERRIDREREFYNYAGSRNSVFFDFDSAAIRGEGIERVNMMIYELSKISNVKVLLRGYTDRVGSKDYNYRLSLKRANAVKSALVNSGVIRESHIMIEIKGFGEYDPITPTSAPDNDACSRRVDMHIIQYNELQQRSSSHCYPETCSCNHCR